MNEVWQCFFTCILISVCTAHLKYHLANNCTLSLPNIWEGSEVSFPGWTCEAVNQILACLCTCLLIHKEDLWKNMNSEDVSWLPDMV